ncbi:maleylpyruvate isomerase family mycothiol-dependent enzyme [Georgenia sp. 10Sc9-8]|uniref:Maleylpyruvate isomerase family mycothiol-dependent enzyme n=1 Tax=Georgenia halotolerans TaxID=3028317 RepID=A0ABT5TW89_9MICO|nr:maleylpyruvate isomerase family mycothiol-dependent enzyme [Georgenia halotolerans]
MFLIPSPEVQLVAAAMSRQALWRAVHAERAALAGDLAELTEAQWTQQSLCGSWTVHDVVAHLTAAARVGRLRWLTSVVGARFDANLHNQRRLTEHRGTTPAETLERFRHVVSSTTAASGHTAAWLGEVVVHAQDIRRPLGLSTAPDRDAVSEVARFYAQRDFTVPSRSTIDGLRLEATDSFFATGSGPMVRGSTLALTMAMAGRSAYHDDLSGPGVATLGTRGEAAAT